MQMRPGPAPDRQGESGMPDPSAVESRGVLVVEDDAALRRLLVATLKRRRLNVDLAVDGQEGVQRLATNKYCVVTLDLMMPKMSGWEVIQWLKEHPEHRPPSVLVVTAADRGVFRELDPELVNAILIKPFDIHVLGSYIAACCRRKGRDRRRKRVVTPVH